MKSYLFGLISLIAGPLVLAQSMERQSAPPASSTAGAEKSTATDSTFLKKLAQGDLAEVAAGHLASDRATNPGVKEFGEHMVRDHSKNSAELQALAKEHGVEVPTTIDREHAAAKAKLDSASGATFDSEYVKAQVRDHEKTAQLLKHEIQDGQDPAVRDFAQKTLPVVEHHLSMAKDLESKLPNPVAERGSQ
jgi:putative membrane protein